MEWKQAKERVEEMKKELRKTLLGKFMIRQNKSYKGLDAEGVYTFNVYYDTPTSANKGTILDAITKYGFECDQRDSRVIGGTYGYIFMFRSPRNSK